MASDSSSSTPMLLTPESTGSVDSNLSAPGKKARRQTAFYPNVNSTNKPQKPFSRSAAKRESVMALGSIEHLQYHFTKTGLAVKKDATDKNSKIMVPAIGGLAHVQSSSPVREIPHFVLPPTPAVPSPPTRISSLPTIKTYEVDPENLLPGVIDDLMSVSEAWQIPQEERTQQQSGHELNSNGHNPEFLSPRGRSSSGNFDVLSVLKTTTHAIRSVRNYVVSLPDESVGDLRAQFRPGSTASSSPMQKRLTPQKSATPDPLTLIRKRALSVLSVLRELEESSRLPLSDEAYDAQSDIASSSGGIQGSPSCVASPMSVPSELAGEGDTSLSYSLVQVEGRDDHIMVWEDEDVLSDLNEVREKREYWDERLVVGGGWLYKQDIQISSLESERETIERYLDVVDTILFGGTKDGQRGWKRDREKAKLMKEKGGSIGRAKARRISSDGGGAQQGGLLAPTSSRQPRRVVSVGMLNSAMKNLAVSEESQQVEVLEEENEVVDDDELPEWAKRSLFADSELSRAHNLLFTFLPANLLPALPRSAADRNKLLDALSSGQLLCIAFNACVRRSRNPWGFINTTAVHDILTLERDAFQNTGDTKESDKEKTRRGWTFRRTDNLRLWVGGLRLRYTLPVISPTPIAVMMSPSLSGTSSASSSPTKTRFTSHETPIMFDAPLVARHDPGWEEMLEKLLLKWVQAVVDERRGILFS